MSIDKLLNNVNVSQLFTKKTLIVYLNQSIVQLWQKYKNIKRKARAGLLIQSINFSKGKPLSGSSYTKLPKVLDHPRKGLINIKNIDHSEFLK